MIFGTKVARHSAEFFITIMIKSVLVLFAFSHLSEGQFKLPFSFPFFNFNKSSHHQHKAPDCSRNTVQLTGLFGLMCNNIAIGEGSTVSDACIGCFQRASTANNNQPSLQELSICAAEHLPDTRYEPCTNQVRGSAPANAGGCVTGYCEFVRCIRRVNADYLMFECYAEADNSPATEDEIVAFVKGLSSCILARARCSSINPITGQRQTNTITTTTYEKWGKPKTTTIPLYNSLQISSTGDLRIISLPGTIKIQEYFCTPQPNLQESTWLDFSC